MVSPPLLTASSLIPIRKVIKGELFRSKSDKTNSTKMRTLAAGLALLVGQNIFAYGPVMAGTIISILPLIILYAFMQKYFVQSAIMSGLKGDHGIYLKGPHLYDCCVRIPLIISWPGHVRVGKTDALVELTDLAPTIMEAVNLPVWAGIQGLSLWNLLTEASDFDFHRSDVFAEYYNAMPTHKDPLPYLTMLRTSEYKMICQHGQEHGELYHMVNDPNETNNLWYEPEYVDIRFKLLKHMCDRIVFTCDPLPLRVAVF